MMKSITFTLYDIFGYLMPGVVATGAFGILAWTIFFNDIRIVEFQLGVDAWGMLLFASYLFGHMAQAIGNLLERPLLWGWRPGAEWTRWAETPDGILKTVRQKISTEFGVSALDLDISWVCKLCDEALVQHGVVSDREVFQYREGFYRGLTVSFLALAVSLALRTAVPCGPLILPFGSITVDRGFLLFLCVAAAFAFVLCLLRLRRFAAYRSERAILGFLVLK